MPNKYAYVNCVRKVRKGLVRGLTKFHMVYKIVRSLMVSRLNENIGPDIFAHLMIDRIKGCSLLSIL